MFEDGDSVIVYLIPLVNCEHELLSSCKLDSRLCVLHLSSSVASYICLVKTSKYSFNAPSALTMFKYSVHCKIPFTEKNTLH